MSDKEHALILANEIEAGDGLVLKLLHKDAHGERALDGRDEELIVSALRNLSASEKPIAFVGDEVDYIDRHSRTQRGAKVSGISAHWTSRGRVPLIIYDVTHPTYHNNRTYVTAADIIIVRTLT